MVKIRIKSYKYNFKVNSVDDGMICAGIEQGGDSKLASFDDDDYGEDGEVDEGYGGGGDDWSNRMPLQLNDLCQTENYQICKFLALQSL